MKFYQNLSLTTTFSDLDNHFMNEYSPFVTSSYETVNHEMKKKFACVICSKAFGRLWNLERHIKNIHSERLPHCKCDKSRIF